MAAMEREVRPLVRRWPVTERQHDGHRFRFYENGDTVVVCGGIGEVAARRAAEAAIALFDPEAVCSAGFAGALDASLKVGDVLRPHIVINAGDGSRVIQEGGEGALVSFGSVASPDQKTKLRNSFGAQAVDMEAAAVARAAETRGKDFSLVKAISDEVDFEFPSMERFVDSEGRFSEARFALYTALRPWLWFRVLKLARNSKRAAHALCRELQRAAAA